MLHVLPHPGGGGETYLRALERLEGYRGERCMLGASAQAGAAGLIWRGAVPVTLRALDHDLVHVHGEPAAGLCLPALALKPSVVTLHGLHLLRRLEGGRRRMVAATLRLVLGAATRTICVSQAEMTDLVAAVGARAARRAVVIRNGVSPATQADAAEKAAARARFSIPDDAVVAVFVGALDSVKDPMVAAQAARRAGVSLILAGDGPWRAEVEASGGRVLGRLDDVRPALAAADFFVLPSRREGLSFAVLEAMAAGLAPVVSDAPGNPEAVGDAGIVARCGDVDGFAAACARLRDDASLRRELASRARSRAEQEFSLARMLGSTRAIYDEVLATRV